MEMNCLDCKVKYYHVLKYERKLIFLTGNKRSLTMTNVKYCSFDQCTRIQILLVCLTVNDTLRTVLNNLLSIECNK